MADAYLKVKDNGAQGLALEREEADVSVQNLSDRMGPVEDALFDYLSPRSETHTVTEKASAYSEPYLLGTVLAPGTQYKIRLDKTGDVVPSNVKNMTIYGANESGGLILGTNLSTLFGTDYERTVPDGVTFYGFRVYRQNGIYDDGTLTLTVSIRNANYEQSVAYRLSEAEDDITGLTDTTASLQTAVGNLGAQDSYLAAHKVAKPASDPDGENGQVLKSTGDGGTVWSDAETPTEEQIREAVDAYITDNPGSVLAVPDGSVTYAKFHPDAKKQITNDFVTPAMFGAAGDGTTDDYAAFSDAIAYCKQYNAALNLDGKTYYLSIGLDLTSSAQLVIYSEAPATLIVNYQYSPLVKVTSHVTLRNISIKPTQNGSYLNHFAPENLNGLKGLWVYGSRNIFENVEVSLCYAGFYVASDRSNGSAYNVFRGCRSRNCAVGIDIYAYGASGYCNEMTFDGCEVRIDSQIKTVFEDPSVAYDDRYAVYIRHGTDREYTNNCLRFIDCCFEGCYNGVRAKSVYCMFINCRTDGIAGKYYTFINTSRSGWNVVIGGYGYARSAGTSGLIDRIEEIDEEGNVVRKNYILYRNYPFTPQWLELFNSGASAVTGFLTEKDKGLVIFNTDIDMPVYWDGTRWRKFDGTAV